MVQHNLSKGNLLHNMIWFSLPYLLSYFLQTLYGLADLLIAGHYNGADVISAVSIGSQVMHMVTVMLVGLAMGSTVMIGQYVGAEDERRINKAIGNTITFFAVTAVVVTVLLNICIHPIVSVLSTPAEAVPGTVSYLQICFTGIPFIIAYNVLSSVFRGMGDSKSPLIFITIACFVNIILDILFMGPMHMGAAGAAYGTILAQAVSVVIAFAAIIKKKLFEIQLTDLYLDRFVLEKILGVGVPISFQDGFIQISFLVITVIANQRGVDISAAVGIVEKTISFLFLVPSAMLSTVSTIVAQSVGAGDLERAGKTLKYGVIMSFSIGTFFAVLFQFISPLFFGMFTDDPVVKEYAVQYMRTYVIDCAIAGVHFSFSGFFSACNRSVLSFIHNLVSVILVRVPGAWLATKLFPDTLYAMGLAAPAGSLLSVIICTGFYIHIKKQEKP